MQRYGFNKIEQPPTTAKKLIDAFQGRFPAHLISLRGDIGWPGRSPDLSHYDYLLWGYVKEEVYKHRPTTIDGLKATIRRKVKRKFTRNDSEGDEKL